MRLAPRSQLHVQELVANLTLVNLRATYRDSALGFGWSMVNPLVTILVYSAVFSLILRGGGPVGDPSGLTSYGLFLASAIIPWQFTQNAISGQASSVLAYRGLIEKVYLPRWVLPLSSLLATLIEFLIEMMVLIVLLAVIWQAWAVKFIPILAVVMVLQTVFLFGIGLALSPVSVYFRDTSHLVALTMKLWFWLTPIIYPLELIADQNRTFLGVDLVTIWKLNPLYWYFDAYRDLTFDLRIPSLGAFGIMAAWGAASFAVGTLVYRRLNPRVIERL